MAHATFGELAVRVLEVVAAGDRGAFVVEIEGVRDGPRVRLRAADFVHVRDGKLVELWNVQAPG
jgi:ketosteroid isomerase-like protein